MPPTTEGLSRSFVGEASFWIPADEKEREAVRANNSSGTRYGQSSNTQFRARGFAEREGEVQKQVTPEGVAGVDGRRATPPDPRLPRRGLAGCRQLDPSHPTLVTCEDADVERCQRERRPLIRIGSL
jgi:hypothetical protein